MKVRMTGLEVEPRGDGRSIESGTERGQKAGTVSQLKQVRYRFSVSTVKYSVFAIPLLMIISM